VIAEVGSGSYGKVYKAECLKTNDFVALKKIDTKDPKIVSEGNTII
jgi:cyclin-dependent kinase 12/13